MSSSPETATYCLYDLTVSVIGRPDTFVCDHSPGVAFRVVGEDLVWVQPRFSQYALVALAPLLPAKQRETAREDWMTSDMDVACPDPNCGARFHIERDGQTTFERAKATRVPLPQGDSAP